MRNVRVWFTKTGRAKYISHLDINRCMTRAVRRAELPLWYTEGYNPHPYMTFSLPLPLGVESLCESMDIRIEDESFTNEMVKAQLDAVMPEGLRVQQVNDRVRKAKEIAYAEYRMCITASEPADAVIDRLRGAIESCQLLAEKKSKSGRKKIIKTINLVEFIKSYSFSSDGRGAVELHMTLSAGPVKNVNPILMLDTVLARAGVIPESVAILRKQLFTEQMEVFQ